MTLASNSKVRIEERRGVLSSSPLKLKRSPGLLRFWKTLEGGANIMIEKGEEQKLMRWTEELPKGEDFDLPLLSEELKGKEFKISGARIEEGKQGEYAVVEVGNQSYRTTSKVLIDQLQTVGIDKINEQGIHGKLTEKRSEDGNAYLSFA